MHLPVFKGVWKTLIGASLSEPQGVMMSTALACVRAYLCACVRTYVRVDEACLGTTYIEKVN